MLWPGHERWGPLNLDPETPRQQTSLGPMKHWLQDPRISQSWCQKGSVPKERGPGAGQEAWLAASMEEKGSIEALEVLCWGLPSPERNPGSSVLGFAVSLSQSAGKLARGTHRAPVVHLSTAL
jgi:hypothetical protein